MQVPQHPDRIQVQQSAQIAAFVPRVIVSGKGADRTVLEVRVAGTNPHGTVGAAPERPAADACTRSIRQDDEERDFVGKSGEHQAVRHKPRSLLVGV